MNAVKLAGGRLDGQEQGGRTYSGSEIADLIMTHVREGQPEPVTISRVVVTSRIDLSCAAIPVRLVFEDCDLEEGVTATGATIAGLELRDVRASVVALDWATIVGDLRCVGLTAPLVKTDKADMSEGPENPRSADQRKSSSDGAPPSPTPPQVERPGSPISLLGLQVTGATSLHRSIMQIVDRTASVPQSAGNADSRRVGWEKIAQVVGLGSGLAAWVAVVGGATLWARMESIGAPSLPSLAALGEGWVLTAGLQTLLVPILLGATAALLLYYSRDHPSSATTLTSPRPDGSDEKARPRPLVALDRLPGGIGKTQAATGVAVASLIGTVLYVANASWIVLFSTGSVLIAAPIFRYWLRKPTGDGAKKQKEGDPAPKSATYRRVGAVIVYLLVVAATWIMWILATHSVGPALLVALFWGLITVALTWAMRLRDSMVRWLFVAVAIIGVVASLLASITAGWVLFIAFVTVLFVWIALGASVDRSPGAAAILLFTAIVVWSGAVQYGAEIGARYAAFPFVNALMVDGGNVPGLLVGRTSDVVLVAEQVEDTGANGRKVHVLPANRVREVVYGGTLPVGPLVSKGPRIDWWPSEWFNSLGDVLRSTTRSPDPTSPDPTPTASSPSSTSDPEPFDPEVMLGALDAEVAGTPVRVQLLGVHRSGGVAYLELQVVNLDADQSHTVAELLGLEGGDLDTPRLVHPSGLESFGVSRTGTECDCARGLDTVVLGPHEQRNLDAVFVLPQTITTVDVSVPAFGTFYRVTIG